MLNTETIRKVEMPDRLCYFCNEGHCAQCTGWDKTVLNGEIVLVACAHECRPAAPRKSVQRAGSSPSRSIRKA